MDLRIRDVARLLRISEQTAYRWARDESLRSYLVNDDYRFNRVEPQEWAATTHDGAFRALLAEQASQERIIDRLRVLDAPSGSPPADGGAEASGERNR